MKLTKQQRAILVGTVLGDGRLQKTGSKNVRLRLEHGGRQKEYLFWKGNQFPNLFNGAPNYIERKHPSTQRIYTYWRWQSHSTPELGFWYRIFYGEGKKQIPKMLVKFLQDPMALAVWYMDDGFYDQKQRHSLIYLGRVMRAEADIACRVIEKNFAVNPRVYDKKEKGFTLFFPVEETKKLHALIRSHVHESMNYKLSLTP